MKFMTPATVKNLPSYLAEDRQRSLLRREEERYQEEKDSKEMAAEFASAVWDVTRTAENQEELNSGLSQVKMQFKDFLTPEMMRSMSGAVQQWGTDDRLKKEWAMKQEDRSRGKFLENQAISDTNILGQLAGSEIDKSQGGQGLLSSGGMEYDVPVSKQDLLGQLSGGGLLGYQEMLGKQADAKRQAEIDAANLAKTRAQTEQIGKPRQEATPMSYREWQLAESPGRYEDWVNRGKGSTGNKITPNTEQDVFESVLPSVLSKSGITAADGFYYRGDEEVLPEEIRAAQQEAGRMTAQVVKLMREGMGMYEAIEAVQQDQQPQIDFDKTYTAEEVQQIGARKGKDGNWYYPLGNGKYQPLQVSGGVINPPPGLTEPPPDDPRTFHNMPKRNQQ